jgi:hypothetical protein
VNKVAEGYRYEKIDEGTEFKLRESKGTSTELQGVEEIIRTTAGEGFRADKTNNSC